ncbi:MAG: FAD-dependent oxidoreductase [bacterium]
MAVVMEIKDLVIIGAGPAGITAAVYAARKKMDFTVISRDIGGQAAWAGEVGNFPGYQFIPGIELAQKFREHLEKFKFDLKEGEEAVKIEKRDSFFCIRTLKGEEIFAKTVIIATGKRPRWLNVPGEAKYMRKGVNFCATCDGPLFAGKNVAVIGGGNSALDAVLQMMKIAAKVYLINAGEQLGGDAIMQEKVKASPVVEVLNKTKTLEFTGEQFLKGMKLEVAGAPRSIEVEGAFVEIGLVPNAAFTDLVKKNELGEIIINTAAETSEPGVFAAGDVTNVPEKQMIIAAGEGAKATLAAFKYLSTHK